MPMLPPHLETGGNHRVSGLYLGRRVRLGDGLDLLPHVLVTAAQFVHAAANGLTAENVSTE